MVGHVYTHIVSLLLRSARVYGVLMLLLFSPFVELIKDVKNMKITQAGGAGACCGAQKAAPSTSGDPFRSFALKDISWRPMCPPG